MRIRSIGAVLAGLALASAATAAGPAPDVLRGAELILQLKADGIGIFLISHDIHDVFDLADRVFVMKNGRVVGSASRRS